MNALYKGFTRSHLEWAYGVRFEEAGVVVPYLDVNGNLHREKLFSAEGKALRWLGDPKPQIPYSLDTLAHGGDLVFLTEGESCCWTLRATYPKTPVIGLPGASSWRPEWARLFERFPVIYLSFDNDEAGRGLTDTVWPFLPWARRVRLPGGIDTRDLIQLHGGVARYEALLRDADHIAACTRLILEGKEAHRAAA